MPMEQWKYTVEEARRRAERISKGNWGGMVDMAQTLADLENKWWLGFTPACFFKDLHSFSGTRGETTSDEDVTFLF